ncbi:TRAP transporter small permease subunit [Polaromonas sp.]|uniref:TRAP transporter small permease n=1 Tax=Polaromonas sp. TaxID=1869339 RepID=UPI00286CBEA1|nr:TRAP transporter small permease subunit [Polaromonas sp.]
MRRLLDALYDGAAWVGALFMVGTLLSVLAGVLDRQFAWSLRGTDMYAGYCMAASGFLALAHTLKKGEHIRVTLMLNALKGRARRALELWAMAAATALASLFAWYSVKLSINSWQFHDVSTGNDATPLWIPQITMGVGAVILMIAFIDELVLEISGRRVQVDSEEALHHE